MEPGETYHIFNHGNANDNIFRTNENYSYFLRKFKEHTGSITSVYAYCLLPNHFHFLISIKEIDHLKTIQEFKNLPVELFANKIIQRFSNFFNSYSKAFNKRFNRRGKLFQLPFKRKLITNPRQFLNTWKYIHYNPVHHGFVAETFAWSFSSIPDYRHNKIDPIILLESQLKSDTTLFCETMDFKPNWNDFIEFDY